MHAKFHGEHKRPQKLAHRNYDEINAWPRAAQHCKTPGRRLVSTQPRSVTTYNKTVKQQFRLHRIPERMDVVDRLSRICDTPTSPWLKSMMVKLYQQIEEIRVHAEKKCRDFLTPAAEYSAVIQHWYNRKGNVRKNSKRRNISNPSDLSVEEIQDALKYCRIRASNPRKQAKSLRKPISGSV